MPLKRHHVDLQAQVGNKLTPDEFDQDQQYIIMKPTASATWFGTAELTAAGGVPRVNEHADFPRNVRFAMTGVAGGVGGTITVSGEDQFGGTVTESLGFASANAGGTVNGTSIFARVGTIVLDGIDGLGGTAVGTISVGVQSGTSSAGPLFGLPAKLGATTDIKRGVWVDAGTNKQLSLNAAAPSINADTDVHAIRVEVTGGAVAADDFVVTYRSSYDATEDGTIAKT